MLHSLIREMQITCGLNLIICRWRGICYFLYNPLVSCQNCRCWQSSFCYPFCHGVVIDVTISSSLPVGVLFDCRIGGSSLPWKITVHFKGFPTGLVSTQFLMQRMIFIALLENVDCRPSNLISDGQEWQSRTNAKKIFSFLEASFVLVIWDSEIVCLAEFTWPCRLVGCRLSRYFCMT